MGRIGSLCKNLQVFVSTKQFYHKNSRATTARCGGSAFTGGQNSGYSRSVASYVPSSGPGVPHVLTLMAPLPFPVAAGDAFTVYPGCDKQIATCTLFANLVNFGGFPFIPVPETAV